MTSSIPSSSIHLASYQLLERVGEGGMAHVYRAVDPAGRVLAVKLLSPSTPAGDPAARARFAREVSVLSTLHHPVLPELIDHGFDEELGPWLVMPFITGTTLRTLLTGVKLCPEGALVLLARLLDGLAAVHEVGLVHRDIKPENVMLSPQGELRLLDLGLAFQPGQTRYTEENAVTGSVPYLSPEQIDGRSITPAGDIWAVGVMAYEWIAGKRPFERNRPAEEVAAILAGAYKPLEGIDRRVSRELATLLGSCLRLDAQSRPADARALAAHVNAMIDWVPPSELGAELSVLAADPAGYQARIAPYRVATLKREAEAAQASGDAFGALRRLDRALAYRPNDAELLARVEQASTVAPAVAAVTSATTTVAPRPRPRWLTWALLASVAALGIAGGFMWSKHAGSVAVPSAPSSPSPSPALSPSAPSPSPFPSPPSPGSSSAVASDMPLGLTPLDPSTLSNSDPEEPLSEQAKPGENLVPAELMGVQGPAAALVSLEKQVAASPNDLALRIGFGMVLLGNGKNADGMRELNAVMKMQPDNVAGLGALGYLALRKGDKRGAYDTFTRILTLDPRNVDAMRNRGILNHRLGHTRDSYTDLVAALRVDPDDRESLKELAQIYQGADRRDDARPLLVQLTHLDPGDAGMWLDLSLVEPKPTDALADVTKSLALAPNLPRAHERRCNVLARMQSPDAVPACTRALELTPDVPGVLMDRGVAHYHGGDDVNALVDMDRAIKLRQKDGDFYTNRYLVHAHDGNLAAARADLAAACKLGKDVACAELAKQTK